MLRSAAGPVSRPARLTAVGLVALAPMALPAVVAEVEPRPGTEARRPARPILALPELGRFSYRCDGERRFSVIFAPSDATVYAWVAVDGRALEDMKRVDPGQRRTTPFGRYRSQRWRVLYDHKPGRITARIDLRFRVDAIGDCFVSPITAVVRRKSHAARPEPRASGRWRALPGAPRVRGAGLSNLEAARVGPRAVFIAGGSSVGLRVGGLSLDLRSHQWARLPSAPLPHRGGHSVVGTGREAIVWGGGSSTGGILDPGRNRWRRMAGGPLADRGLHAAVWTGARMVVWGGSGRRGPLADGASYDPTRDHWRRIAPGPLSARARTASVWTGRELVIWGGDASRHSYGERDVALRDGAAYDPATNRWRRIARAPIAASADAEAVWTGQAMLVWTGREGAAYNPARDRWRRIPRAPLTRRQQSTAVWDGTRMLVWGGVIGGDLFLADGAAYYPRTRRWLRLPRSPLAPRDRHAAVATRSGMAVFGGCCKGTTRQLPDGALYESR